MARARNIMRCRRIKPEFFLDDRLSDASTGARLLLMGLWAMMDDLGVVDYPETVIKSEVFPHNRVNVYGLLAELRNCGAIASEQRIRVVDWGKWCEPRKVFVDKGYSAARRTRKMNAMPPWVDREAIKAIYIEARRLRDQTGKEWHVDHIVPLAGKAVCGLHVDYNLQIIPASENQRKSNHFDQGVN